MPVMDGITFLLEKNKDITIANIPVILVSANPAMLIPLELDVNVFLQKPVALTDLIKQVALFCVN